MRKVEANLKPSGLGAILTVAACALKAAGSVPWSWLVCSLPLIIGVAATRVMVDIKMHSPD